MPRNFFGIFPKILIYTRTLSKVPLEPPPDENPPPFVLGARKKHAFYLRTVMKARLDGSSDPGKRSRARGAQVNDVISLEGPFSAGSLPAILCQQALKTRQNPRRQFFIRCEVIFGWFVPAIEQAKNPNRLDADTSGLSCVAGDLPRESTAANSRSGLTHKS
jgi:hypothetical protein